MFLQQPKQQNGFTLVELLVVIAIISLLSSIVLASLSGVTARGRDAKRKQDLLQLRTGLELYYSEHGSYPLPYPVYWSGVDSSGCNASATNGTTRGATAYITGLIPADISVLPTDPKPNNNGCSGYLYQSDGKNYKLLIHQTWEEAFPTSGTWYDPVRPTWALMLCSGEPACSTW